MQRAHGLPRAAAQGAAALALLEVGATALVGSNRMRTDTRAQIADSERKFRWPQGRRPDDHPGLSDLGL